MKLSSEDCLKIFNCFDQNHSRKNEFSYDDFAQIVPRDCSFQQFKIIVHDIIQRNEDNVRSSSRT